MNVIMFSGNNRANLLTLNLLALDHKMQCH